MLDVSTPELCLHAGKKKTPENHDIIYGQTVHRISSPVVLKHMWHSYLIEQLPGPGGW